MTEQPTPTFIQQEQKPPVKAGWILLLVSWICYLVPIPGLGPLGICLNLVALITSVVVIVKGKVGMGIFQLTCGTLISGLIYTAGMAIFVGATAFFVNGFDL